jgi:hypothetical protein
MIGRGPRRCWRTLRLWCVPACVHACLPAYARPACVHACLPAYAQPPCSCLSGACPHVSLAGDHAPAVPPPLRGALPKWFTPCTSGVLFILLFFCFISCVLCVGVAHVLCAQLAEVASSAGTGVDITSGSMPGSGLLGSGSGLAADIPLAPEARDEVQVCACGRGVSVQCTVCACGRGVSVCACGRGVSVQCTVCVCGRGVSVECARGHRM